MIKNETPKTSLTEDIVNNMLDKIKKKEVYNETIIDKLEELEKNKELTKSDKVIEALKSDLEDKEWDYLN